MLVFPQLTTGAAALYPVTRQSVMRTVVNTLGDGHTSRVQRSERRTNDVGAAGQAA